jgi:type I restriction enzyme, S subunit
VSYLAVSSVASAGKDWEWIPLRRLARIRREANSDSSSVLLALSSDRGVEPRADDGGRQLPSESTVEGYWRVYPNDLVFNPMWAIGGGVAVSAIKGAVSTAYRIYAPGPRIWPRFLHYWLRSEPAINQYKLMVRGITTFDRSITREDVEGMPIPTPDLATQQAIADYLDREAAQIDALVAAKRRMAELLEERRRAVRDQAFDSEPGWRLKRLLADSLAYGVLVPQFVEVGTGVPMIRTYNLTAKGRVSHEDIAEIPVDLAREYRRTSLRKDDVILSVVGLMGRSAVVSADEQGFNLNRPLARLQLRLDVPSRLIWHWTQTTHFMDMAKLVTGGGTAQPTLNLGDLANFTVGLPQETRLWPKVLAVVEETCGQLDKIDEALSRQVGLLQERRQALITAAVTGQLAIPEAA